MKKIALFLMGLVTLLPAKADEGMWTMYNLPKAVYEQMKAYGFSLPQESIYGADNAISRSVVLFGGFCTGVCSIAAADNPAFPAAVFHKGENQQPAQHKTHNKLCHQAFSPPFSSFSYPSQAHSQITLPCVMPAKRQALTARLSSTVLVLNR